MVKFLLRVQEAPVRFRAAPAIVSLSFYIALLCLFCALSSGAPFFRALLFGARALHAFFLFFNRCFFLPKNTSVGS